MIKSFTELHEAARAKLAGREKLKLGVIYPTDEKYIDAVNRVVDEGYVQAFMIGPESDIERMVENKNIPIEKFEYVNADGIDKAFKKTADLADKGELDLILKGAIRTRDFVDKISDVSLGLAKRKALLSHIGVVHSERYPKLMLVTDCAVVPTPDAAQMIQIVQNAAGVCKKLGVEMPKAGLLAAVEAIYPAIPTTMMEAAVAKMSDRGQIKNVLIDGPLSFDVAISTEVAHSKGIVNSKVAGDTDIFCMSTMETANGVYKAMVMYAKAEGAGVIVGGSLPIASPFEVDSADNIFNSIVLAAYLV